MIINQYAKMVDTRNAIQVKNANGIVNFDNNTIMIGGANWDDD